MSVLQLSQVPMFSNQVQIFNAQRQLVSQKFTTPATTSSVEIMNIQPPQRALSFFEVHPNLKHEYFDGVLILDQNDNLLFGLSEFLTAGHSGILEIMRFAFPDLSLKKLLWSGEIEFTLKNGLSQITRANETSGTYYRYKIKNRETPLPFALENDIQNLIDFLQNFSSDLIAPNAEWHTFKSGKILHLLPDFINQINLHALKKAKENQKIKNKNLKHELNNILTPLFGLGEMFSMYIPSLAYIKDILPRLQTAITCLICTINYLKSSRFFDNDILQNDIATLLKLLHETKIAANYTQQDLSRLQGIFQNIDLQKYLEFLSLQTISNLNNSFGIVKVPAKLKV